ncbi:MAG: hypothetical protein ACKESB_03135 [Candidatus Hodgkinia cicadicola]
MFRVSMNMSSKLDNSEVLDAGEGCASKLTPYSGERLNSAI